MGIIGAFKTVGKALGKGLLKSGRTLAKIDDIPGMTTVVAMIPVAGPVLAAATRRCNMAESLLGPKAGARKKEWARWQLSKDLRRLGVAEKYIDELTSVGLLVSMGQAVVRELEEPKPAKGWGSRREEPEEMPPVDTPEPDLDEEAPAASEGLPPD